MGCFSEFRPAKKVGVINGAVCPFDVYQILFDGWCADFFWA